MAQTPTERDGRLSKLGSGALEKPISIISGFHIGGKTNVRPVKLPRVENVPHHGSIWTGTRQLRTSPSPASSQHIATTPMFPVGRIL